MPGLFALVECLVPTDSGSYVLLELVATSKGADKHVSLEPDQCGSRANALRATPGLKRDVEPVEKPLIGAAR
jgi:hypothetical protein